MGSPALSDADLHKNVVAELAFDPSVDDRNIAIAVRDGVVTLSGTVRHFAQKAAANGAVKRVGGVHALAENITIDLPELHVRNDTDLALSALEALRWNSIVPQDSVMVEVENGHITLTGSVDWQFQRETVRAAVASLAGVRGIINDIDIRTQETAENIKSKIGDSFRRSASIDAARISVEARGGIVTLSGTVHSWAEREDAVRAAYSVGGVTDVENLTTIA